MSNRTRLQAMIDESGLLPINQTGIPERSLDRIINDFPVTFRHGVIHFKADHVSPSQDCECKSGDINTQGKESFGVKINKHQRELQKRGNGQDASKYAMATDHLPPVGQAYDWFHDVKFQVSEYGREVAHQIARLCGDDSQVTTTLESLYDAVSKSDKTGQKSFTERGIRELVASEWLSVEVTGRGRGSQTTYFLQVGEDTEYKKKWDDSYYTDAHLIEWDMLNNHHIA